MSGATEYASTAAQAVRLLNHATIAPGSFLAPQEVDAALAELALLGQRLPQSLDQLARGLLELHNAGRVGHDTGLTGLDLDVEVNEAAEALGSAMRAAEALAAALDEARQITAHFTGGAR